MSIKKGLDRLDTIEEGRDYVFSYTVETEEHEAGFYSYVVIPDHMWARAVTTDYIGGIPMLWKNK